MHLFHCPNMVGVAGLEPAASWSRTKRDTKLRHTPKAWTIISISAYFVKSKKYILPESS